jgi:hypothetical protein|eukprot:COSAG06_NODE_3349_length_5474_cov_4.677953_5_plen_61_part_00
MFGIASACRFKLKLLFYFSPFVRAARPARPAWRLAPSTRTSKPRLPLPTDRPDRVTTVAD